MRQVALALLTICTLSQATLEQLDTSVLARMRDEAMTRSQVMDTVEYLADVIGPRLTGSPNLKAAQQYAIERLREFGVSGAHVEPWGPFGRGWVLESFSAAMTRPEVTPLIAYSRAWSASTDGTIRGDAVYIDATTPEDLARFKGRLHDRIVLLTPPRPVPEEFATPPARMTDAQLAEMANPAPATPRRPDESIRARIDMTAARWRLLFEERPALVVEPAPGDAGTMWVTSTVTNPSQSRTPPWSPQADVLPHIVVASEQYNRMARVAARGVPVTLDVTLKTRFLTDDLRSGNLIAEIPGTDLKDEVVMIGGCLDSWHAGTGATDNAAGVAVAIEVMRVFRALQLKPRRTIRIGLWSAEEQGHLGSNAYVAEHLGTRTAPKPERDRLSAYFNLDYGTGRIRGIYAQGNPAVVPIFERWLEPLHDAGASTVVPGTIGATDHVPFDEAGVPAFQFLRDFMEGGTRTSHSNMDVYDHVLPDDLKQSVLVAAWFVYNAAMREQPLPRK